MRPTAAVPDRSANGLMWSPLQLLDEALGGRHKFFRLHILPPHDVVVLGR